MLFPLLCKLLRVNGFLQAIKIFLGLLMALPVLPISAQPPRLNPASPVPDRVILTLTEKPFRSQAVSWRTDSTVVTAMAQIAIADGSPNFTSHAETYVAKTSLLESQQGNALYHTVVFSNLRPLTTYAYRVGDGNYTWSEWFQFRTASKKDDAFSFLYFGDAQNDIKSLWSRVIRQAYSDLPKANFMLHAGDLVNRPLRDHEWGEWFYAGGWVFGSIPSFATPGNHEYYRTIEGGSALTPHWNEIFNFPKNGPSEFRETTYYFDYQGTRFISLNSQAMILDPENIEIQAKWLEKVLKKNPNNWTVVTHHHPVYSLRQGRDNPDLREKLQPLYNKYGVDLVLQGHDHTYGRGKNAGNGLNIATEKGPVYVVSVSGPKMYNLTLDDWMERVASNTQLYQIIHISPKKISYEAYTAVGELYDAFDIEKKGGERHYIDKTPDTPERTEIPPHLKDEYSTEALKAYNERFRKFKNRKTVKRD